MRSIVRTVVFAGSMLALASGAAVAQQPAVRIAYVNPQAL
jgi:hypothetical protein